VTLSVESVSAARAHLWEAGFRPVPIINWDAKGPSPGKRPLGDNWRESALKDPPFCVTIPAVPFALNTGILADELRPIDIDIDDPAKALRVRALAVERFGSMPIRTRANSARSLLLCRAASGQPRKIAVTGATHTKERGCKVEILGAGQQFVALGRHDSGAELAWEPPLDEVTLADLPAITEADVLAFLAEVAVIIDAAPPGYANGHASGQDHYTTADPQADPLRVAAAMAAIPNTNPADWEAWNRVGMALWAATGGSAIGGELWNAWSARHPAYNAEDTEERWLHYRKSPPTHIGAGTLFHMAGGTFQPEPETPDPPAWVSEGPTWESVDTEAQHAAEPPPREEPEQIPFLATEISAAEWADIPPREKVYGHFLFRKFISALGAPGGAGKTAYAFVVAFAVALKRNLLREPVHEQGNVWIYNLEDPRTELLRRVKACAIAYNVNYDEIAPRLFLDSGRDRPLVIAQKLRDGSVIAWPQVPALIAEIKRRGVRLLIVDPFVRSHRVEENHNDEVDFVAALWASVADQADCAILLVHHFKKGGVSGDAQAFRGASALIDASRAAVTLTTMSTEEAQRLNVAEKDRWQYVRVDSAKLNLAPQPENAVWLHLIGIDLENGANGRESDSVQTVERWQPKSVWEDTTTAGLNEALDLIAAGPEPGVLYNASRRGGSSRWAGQVLVKSLGLTDPQASQMIKDWLKNETLEEVEYHHPTHRRLVPGVRVNDANRPGLTL